MELFEVTAKITSYPLGSGNKSIKMIYANNKEVAAEKFFMKINKSGNIDKSEYIIESIKRV